MSDFTGFFDFGGGCVKCAKCGRFIQDHLASEEDYGWICPPRTRSEFDVIAEALPLHAHRILELAIRNDHDIREATETRDSPYEILSGAFPWYDSEEGEEYWRALAFGCRDRYRKNKRGVWEERRYAW